jgi:DNA-binding transcriptional regulator YhcF (GntR family)
MEIRDNRKKGWLWLDNDYLNGYARYLGVNCTVVYLSLCRHADNNTQQCFPSMQLIAEENGIHRTTVIRAIKKLEDWGIIAIKKNKKENGTQANNIYTLLAKTEWKDKPSSTEQHGLPSSTEQQAVSFSAQNRVAQSDTNYTHINKTHRTIHKNPNKDFFELKDTSVLDDFREKIDNATLEEEVKKFILYWTEKSPNGKKQRWEMQKTFDVKRRLFTWFSNQNKWSKEKKQNQPQVLTSFN